MKNVLFILLIVFSTSVISQETKKTIQIGKINQAIKIDGNLNDKAWQNASVATDFIQYEPYNGLSATEKTEVKINREEKSDLISDTVFPDEENSSLGGNKGEDRGNIINKKGFLRRKKQILEIISKKWGRNPFLNINEPSSILTIKNSNYQKENQKKEAKEKLPITVSAILITEDRKIAVVNHKIVTEGDWVEGEEIIRIKRGGIVLSNTGKNRMVAIAQNPEYFVRFEKNRYIIQRKATKNAEKNTIPKEGEEK